MVNISELIGPLSPVNTPELRAIVVSALNGSTTVDGTSGNLGNATDTALLLALRRWSDVVLVGSATVKAENYGGVIISTEDQQARQAAGQRPIPPVAVVSGSLNFDVSTRFFTESAVSPIIVTDNKDTSKHVPLLEAGAEILLVEKLTARDIADKLRAEGYARVTCEGGPSLFAQVIDAGVVDVWHHTLDPTLSGSVEHPLVRGGSTTPHRFALDHIHADPDGTVFLRYKRP
ncbi:hypothetical protein CDES_08465 [Corynebacterium deserti GIMN1.010]|uniref:Bacterial bifunctional deaminase-reductase C-terminal domain-containing protein n=1 Tax=Corynebacterium deserti GIMN1.010 TaxID=931089 RepID=A0A0M5IM40_9CORY|nr:pyrimidine reductase family protein [Corynebacterium deserti]ALC06086.1 hypothetical protein CDES_08465 [Corynebacterium deserti GIMN1.010]